MQHINLLTSAARTATQTVSTEGTGAPAAGQPLQMKGHRGLKVVLDVTVVPGVDTVTLSLEHFEQLSQKWISVLTAAARVATGTDVLTIYPGMAAVANVKADDFVPDKWRALVTHSAAGAFTYSLAAFLLH